jgi:hypothetical protein
VEVPVTKIDITSAGYATVLNASGAGSTLQLTATVEPDNASNKTLSWTQVYSPATTAGKVTIDETGLVTGVKAGPVTVRAAATDGSGAYRDLALTVKPSDVVTGIIVAPVNGTSPVEVGKALQLQATVEPITAYPVVTWSVDNSEIATINASSGLVTTLSEGSITVTATAGDGSSVSSDPYPLEIIPGQPLNTINVEIGGTQYQAYVYMGKTWTVENMKHGDALYSYWQGTDEQRPNNYYTYAQAQLICTDGFSLPTLSDFQELGGALHSPFVEANEVLPWLGTAHMVGYRMSAWFRYGEYVVYWGQGGWSTFNSLNGAVSTDLAPDPNPGYALSVRCVKY